jgi:phosphoglycerate dehydrogenase-like enzyme
MRVLLLSPLPPEAVSHNLDPELGVEVVVPKERTVEAVIDAVRDVDFVMGDYSREIPVTREVVAAMDRVVHFHQPSTGYDAVDDDALTERAIPLTNAGDATSIAMGEHTVMVTLALLKSLQWCDDRVRAGEWPQHEVVGRSLVELSGRTVGLVGMGNAGEEAAKRFRAFGPRLLYTARTRRPQEYEAEHGVEWAELGRLLAEADVVCLLAPLNDQTRGMIDADAIAAMKDGAFLVNPARGELVDQAALIEALRSSKLGGAALDVLETEPPPPDDPLLALDNVLLTPHVGGATLETRLRMMQRSFHVIGQVARGEFPDGVVNGVERFPAR